MQDILKQLQEATENFDNLFEVDGLGEPSADVPPSTNKIKKNVKTKNGKVELVSVEDELFPKEGNAKEQFKQKVLDKINAMIQGTGTLEDLLNTVRTKQVKPVKEGFEGAIEILEEIINEVSVKRWRQAAINSLPQRAVDAYKAEEETEKAEFRGDIDKAFGNQIQKENRLEHAKEVAKTMPDSNKSANKVFQAAKKVVSDRTRKFGENFKKWKTADTKENAYKAHEEGINLGARERHARKLADAEVNAYANRRNYKNSVKEGFEGAIEILEDVLSVIEKKHGSPKYKKDTYEPANKSAELINKVSNIRNREKLQAAEREVDKDRPDLKVHPAERNDKIVNYYGQIVARRNGRAPLKEAVEVLESIISEYTEEDRKEVAKKVRPERAKKFNKACDELDKVTQGKNPDNFTSVQKYRANKVAEKVERAEDRLNHVDDIINPTVNTPTGFKRYSESFEGAIEILEELLSEERKNNKQHVYRRMDDPEKGKVGVQKKYNRLIHNDSQNKDPFFNYVKIKGRKYRVDDRGQIGEPVKEGFEGAIEILEAIINEVSVNRWKEAAKSSIKNREKGDTRFHDNRTDHAKEVASLTNSNRSANSVVKAAKSSIDDRDKKYRTEYKKELVSEPFGYRSVPDANTRRNIERSDKAYRLAGANGKYKKEIYGDHEDESVKEGFEGAIEILEDIINEVSLGKWKETAKKVYDKRKEVADKSAEADKGSWEKYEKEVAKHPEDEPELFKRTVDTGAVAYNDKKRAEHAMGVYANTPDSKHSANKYNKAIKKSLQGRDDKYVKTGKRSDLNRAIDAFHKAKLDPVKNRADESFVESIKILEEVINEVSDKKVERALDFANDKVINGLMSFTGVDMKDVKKARRLEDLANKRAKRQGKKVVEDPDTGWHKHVKEAMEVLDKLLGESKSPEEVKEVAKKVLPNRKSEYLSKYADVLDIADVYGSENVPDGNIKDLNRAEKRYKHAEEKASLKESSYTEDTVNKVAKKVFPQREANAKKAHDSLDHAMNINPYSMVGGKLSQKQREVISKAIDNAEQADNKLAHVKGILNKPKKEDPTGIKFDKILCALEEFKEQINKNYEEAFKNEGFFVNDGRGDLIDDTSKCLTKKTVKQHVVDTAKKLLNPKEKSEK